MSKSHSKPDFEKLAEHYRLQSEVYEIFYSDRIKTSKAFLVFSGVIAQMMSDLVKYEKEKGKSDKTKPLRERIEILFSIYEEFTGMDERIIRLTGLLKNNTERMEQLEIENEKLNKIIHAD